MNKKTIGYIALIMASLLFTVSMAVADEDKKSWLFVQTASDITFTGDQLTIPYEREVFAFTDRPNRLHGYLNAHELTALWDKDENSFGENPPNAVLTWVEEGDIREAEVKLIGARVSDQGRSITYQFAFEAGHELPPRAQRVSLFIDQESDFARQLACQYGYAC